MQNKQTENLFAFVLGRETELSLLELKAVLLRFGFGFCESKNHPERAEDLSSASRTDVPCYTVLSVTDNIAIIKLDFTTNYRLLSKDLISSLGGTIKIFKLRKLSSSDLEKEICDLILSAKHGVNTKVDFGISDYRSSEARTNDKSSRPMGSNDINKLGIEVKKQLKPTLKSRFIFVKEGRELTSIVSESNKLDDKGIEVGVFDCHSERSEESRDPSIASQDDTVMLGQLIALSDPFAWSRRDYGKPEGDKYSGMLPPKLARMMVNLAIGQENLKFKIQNLESNLNSKLEIENFDNVVVVDPFCGSGNIPIEALMLGCDVIASDISEKAVNDTKSNLDWLKLDVVLSKKVFQADATKDDFLQPLSTFNLELSTRDVIIVTEPYLGDPKKFKPSKSAVLGEFKKLKEEYLGFLDNLANLLQTKDYKLRTVCIVFPLVESSDGGRISLWSESIDEIKKIGYTQLRPPLTYGRDYQVVKREIIFLNFVQK